MGEVYFYHLTRTPLEATLPVLLGKSLAAGWRVVVRGTAKERLDWLNEKLWLTGDENFLPHGLAGGEFDEDQPILLCAGNEIKNNADCLMSVDGAEVTSDEVSALTRTCILFDGNDADALGLARTQWKTLTDQGCAAQYWSQESGTWQMKVKSDA